MSLRSLHVDRMKSKIQKIKPTMQLAVAVPSLRALLETSQGSRRDRKGEIRQRPQRGQIPNVFARMAGFYASSMGGRPQGSTISVIFEKP
jgi:hypothetical protein